MVNATNCFFLVARNQTKTIENVARCIDELEIPPMLLGITHRVKKL
jgi:hypothetical protein